MKLGEIFSLVTDSVLPNKGVSYHLYSLPAFDNTQTREELLGEQIESAKYVVPNRCILFNKLNVRFRRVWRIDNSDENKLCSTEFLPLVIDEDKVDFNFCYYLLLSDFITKFLSGQNNNTSGSHKRIDPSLLFGLDIPLPRIDEQKRIGDFLFSIDCAISSSREIVASAGQLISQYYEHWFVQYDFPTLKGKPYKASGGKVAANDQVTEGLPVGWRIGMFGELIDIGDESINPLKLGDRQLEHYSIPAFDASGYPAFDSASSVLSNKFRVSPGDFLVSKLNPQFKRIWDPLCLTDLAICSTEFIVCRSKIPDNKPFCFAVADSCAFQQFLIQHASSSTGSRSRLDPKDILKFPVAIPGDANLIEQFNKICAPCLSAIKTARREIHDLISLREFMLPLLMNGQAKLPPT